MFWFFSVQNHFCNVSMSIEREKFYFFSNVRMFYLHNLQRNLAATFLFVLLTKSDERKSEFSNKVIQTRKRNLNFNDILMFLLFEFLILSFDFTKRSFMWKILPFFLFLSFFFYRDLSKVVCSCDGLMNFYHQPFAGKFFVCISIWIIKRLSLENGFHHFQPHLNQLFFFY